MSICMMGPPGECLQVKADMGLFAGNTLSSVSEHVRVYVEVEAYQVVI